MLMRVDAMTERFDFPPGVERPHVQLVVVDRLPGGIDGGLDPDLDDHLVGALEERADVEPRDLELPADDSEKIPDVLFSPTRLEPRDAVVDRKSTRLNSSHV